MRVASCPGKKVKVGAETHEARKAVVIATGSRVKGIPQIGLEINKTTVISSDEALFLEKLPASIAVIGAGAVGCEFADIFNAFGSKVTLIEALPRILPLEDAESSDVITKSFRKRKMDVFAGAKVTKAAGREGQGDADRRGGRQDRNGAGGEGAHGRRSGRQHREHGIQGSRACSWTERGFVKVNLATLADDCARGLLHRRRGRTSDAGPQGEP